MRDYCKYNRKMKTKNRFLTLICCRFCGDSPPFPSSGVIARSKDWARFLTAPAVSLTIVAADSTISSVDCCVLSTELRPKLDLSNFLEKSRKRKILYIALEWSLNFYLKYYWCCIIQGVPINMGIQWRIRYRLCY